MRVRLTVSRSVAMYKPHSMHSMNCRQCSKLSTHTFSAVGMHARALRAASTCDVMRVAMAAARWPDGARA